MRPTASAIQSAMKLRAEGNREAAVALLRKVVPREGAREPHAADVHHALAVVLMELGRHEQALYHAQRARSLAPRETRLLCLAGLILQLQEKFAEALAAFRGALAEAPTLGEAWGGAANCHVALGEFEAAERAFTEALRHAPGDATILGNAAKFMKETGRPDQAARFYREAVRRGLREPSIIAEMAYAMTCSAERPPAETFGAHRMYGDMLMSLAGPAAAAANLAAPDPDRTLTIGFVSGDFRRHSVACFFEPLLAGLDRGAFRPVLYHTTEFEDETTERLRRMASSWRSIAGADDAGAAAAIRADGVDVLVDLSGLTRGSRLGVFARRPAPLQVGYLGYANTSGLSAVDARIVDAATDPPGSEALAVERLVRLERCFLCYRPPAEAPDPAPVPAGPVCFGSFNNIIKLSEAAVDLWARALTLVPGSKLLIKSRYLENEHTRALVARRFEARGINAGRVEVMPPAATTRAHLELYSRVSVALDSYPYHGTTTTCEALHMGVPVVTLAGPTHASRVGVSILGTLGLGELVAPTPEAFAQVAARLASNAPRLAELRSTLRARLCGSALRDEAAFCREFGGAVRTLWREKCAAAVR